MKRYLSFAILFAAFSFASTGCLKDPDFNTEPTQGNARIEITDAPIDDPNVKGVFVTVADIKVDGQSWDGFQGKTTFNLMAYQKGNTKLLGEGKLDIQSYNEVVLVLDTETDQYGGGPGCYILDAAGNKQKLNGGAQMNIKAKGNFEVAAGAASTAVIDFDLRKAIVYEDASSTQMKFVTDPELTTAVRLVTKAKVSAITGDCTDGLSSSDKVVVYAYKKGTFDINVEKFGQGMSKIQFINAVGSDVVAADGTYQLSFLDGTDYELHFISYKADSGGKLQAKGELQVTTVDPTLSLLGLSLSLDATLNVDVVVTGIVFF